MAGRYRVIHNQHFPECKLHIAWDLDEVLKLLFQGSRLDWNIELFPKQSENNFKRINIIKPIDLILFSGDF